MTQYDNTDTFVLFMETEKKSDKHPDFTGKINMGGVEKRLACWKAVSKDGTKYLQGRVSDFQDAEQRQQQGQDMKDLAESIGDEIPW